MVLAAIASDIARPSHRSFFALMKIMRNRVYVGELKAIQAEADYDQFDLHSRHSMGFSECRPQTPTPSPLTAPRLLPRSRGCPSCLREVARRDSRIRGPPGARRPSRSTRRARY